jgi:hypothetical protein
MGGERRRFASERGEHRLRDVLGEVRVAVELPECGRVDESEVALDEFGESGLGTFFRVEPQQLSVVGHDLRLKLPPFAKPNKELLRWSGLKVGRGL